MNVLEKVFGANWRVSIFGWASKIALGVILVSQVQPALLDNTIGPANSKILCSWCALVWFILGTMKDGSTKDKNVTGGTVRQDGAGEVIAKADVDIANLPEVFEVNDANGKYVRKFTKDATPQELAMLVSGFATRRM